MFMRPDFSELSYATIFISDFSKTLRFYTETLGLPIFQKKNGFAMLDTKPIRLNIHEGKVKNIDDSTEVAFYVDNLEEAYEHLRKNDVRITREPMEYPDGPRMFNFIDPEGNALAAVER
jgi:predicted enzyme related to lactoylglutathione lyase